MVTRYLFNSTGNWIAFQVGRYVFDASSEWIGWLPWQDEEVMNPDGNYLGTICSNNRLLRFKFRHYRGYAGYPGYAGYQMLPVGAEDINYL